MIRNTKDKSLSASFNGTNIRKNAFLTNTMLFRSASSLSASLLSGFEELGAFVSTKEAHDLSRLANENPPVLRRQDDWGNAFEMVELHPAYNALQRRSKNAGLASSLWERIPQENGVRYQARAIRLFLMAGLETGHLLESIHTSAAIAALIGDAELFKLWQSPLLSRQHDFSSRPISQKKGASLTFAFSDAVNEQSSLKTSATAQKISFDNNSHRDIYCVNAVKTHIVNPMADGFFVTAEVDGQLSCFLVSKLQEKGHLNSSMHIHYLYDQSGQCSSPKAKIEFTNCNGVLIGKVGDGAKIISDIETMLNFDYAIVSAGVMRSSLQFAVDFYRFHHKHQAYSSLTERIFADIALDVAACEGLIMRLARAFDRAANDRSEAAFARIMTPVVALHVNNLVVSILGEVISQSGELALLKGNRLSQALHDAPFRSVKASGGNQLIRDTVRMVEKVPSLFNELLQKISVDIGAVGPRTVEILNAAAKVALTDEGTGRLFIEQIAYAAGAAALRHVDMEPVANAYIESRLGGQWRSSYGMLSARHNAGHILSTLYPLV